MARGRFRRDYRCRARIGRSPACFRPAERGVAHGTPGRRRADPRTAQPEPPHESPGDGPREDGNISGSVSESSGDVVLNVDTDYDDAYDREYYLEVKSVTIGANRTATILWSGWDELPFTYGSFTIDDANAASYTRVALENGIYLDLDFGARHLLQDSGDELVSPPATDLASAMILGNEFKTTKFNDHDQDNTVAAHGAGLGTHQITAADATSETTLVALCLDIEIQQKPILP